MREVILQVHGLSAGYDRIPVVREVSFDLARGEMVTIIGANGAGKSTLLKALAGLIKPSGGAVALDGQLVTGQAPERLVRQGLVLIPEGRMLFGPLTVEENLRLGAYTVTSASVMDERIERVYRLFPVLRERASQSAETLSGGEQQMLAIGRGLMSGPQVLLLDEPSLGLAPRVIAAIFEALDALRSQGIAILLVEQDAYLALKHADHGHVMRSGRFVLSGPATVLAANEDVRSIYLGAWHGKE